MRVGKLVSGMGSIGKLASGMGSSKSFLGAVGLGMFGLGVANKVAPATRDMALEMAMGDPNADVAFTGRKIDTRFLVGRAMGGPIGGALQYTAPGDKFSFMGGPIVGTERAVALGTALGGVVGFSGAKFVKKLSGKGGSKAKIAATVLGAAGGAVMGAGAQVRALTSANQRFYDESPYARRTARSMTYSMNAVGDIVLGMHNTRNSY